MRGFLRLAKLYFKESVSLFNLEEFLLLEFALPLFSLIFYCMTASFSFQTLDVTSWVIGNAFLLCINVCVFGLGTGMVRERMYGRLRGFIAAPSNKLSIILAQSIYPIFFSFFNVIIGLALGFWLFPSQHVSLAVAPMLLTILIAMLSASCFGLLISCLGLITDSMHLILNLVATSLIILSGANFPVASLPPFFQKLSHLLPLSHSIAVAKGLFNGQKWSRLIWGSIHELELALVYLLLALLFINVTEKISRKNATLEMM